MTRHRGARVRPRYGRIAVAASSVGVTAFAVLAGAGAFPSAADQPSGATVTGRVVATHRAADPVPDTPAASVVSRAAAVSAAMDREEGRRLPVPRPPADSGAGRRVVFSEGEQRVWLVDADDEIRRTYLVSGSVYDNLDPGTYAVYSRSEQAWGIDDSGTMKYFVRFTQGANAAIGFHDIPVDDGARVQTVADLGTPLSHGCIRQRRADAIALWRFAPIGTAVVVTT